MTALARHEVIGCC